MKNIKPLIGLLSFFCFCSLVVFCSPFDDVEVSIDTSVSEGVVEEVRCERYVEPVPYCEQSINITGNNFCGQFAMVSVLKGMGIRVDDHQQVYEDTNPAGIFTGPSTIVEYMRRQGVPARQRNRASLDDIIEQIDAGRPVIGFVYTGDFEERKGEPHWVNIYDYETDDEGNVTGVVMRDLYWARRRPITMDIDTFKKAWENPMGPGALGHFTNYSNLIIDFEKNAPAPLSTATEDNIAMGINNVVTGFKNRDFRQTLAGVTQCIHGLPAALIGVQNNGLINGGKRLIDWGRQRMADSDGVSVSGTAAVAAGAAINGVGRVGKTIADGLSYGVSLLGRAIGGRR